MATQYYGADVGDQMPVDLTRGTSTTSKPIELVVNDAATGISKVRLLNALEAIRNKIVGEAWPPA